MTKLERKPLATELLPDMGDLYADAEAALGYRVPTTMRNAQAARRRAAEALAAAGVAPFTAASVERYMEEKRYLIPTWLNVSLGILALASLVISIALTVLFGAVFLLGLSVTAAAVAIGAGFHAAVREWRNVGISSYDRQVPEFALQTALDVKRLLPEAQFYIYELRKREVVDPFLAMHFGGTMYFLEVWNEPRFKQVREV